jgi:hypothetical protein
MMLSCFETFVKVLDFDNGWRCPVLKPLSKFKTLTKVDAASNSFSRPQFLPVLAYTIDTPSYLFGFLNH